jgi:hypothetical protein
MVRGFWKMEKGEWNKYLIGEYRKENGTRKDFY